MEPFKPFGPMVKILASTTPPSGTFFSFQGDWNLLVSNDSTAQDAYLVWGASSTAVASATIPVVGAAPSSTAFMVPIAPGFTTTCYTFSGPIFVGGLTSSGNTSLDLVPGRGGV